MGGAVRDPPCDSKGLIRDSGSRVRNGKLVFAEQGVALPGKDGVITETAEDGVAEGKEKHLNTRTGFRYRAVDLRVRVQS